MQVIKSTKELDNQLDQLKKDGHQVAFIATMGALHEGHLEMIKDAKQKYDTVVCSIFVNPFQFNRKEDFETYPYRLEQDKALLIKNRCDILFLPSVDEMYPNKPKMDYKLGELSTTLEGEHRPGHFAGVVAVVSRFFEIIKPTIAYFGEKDFQQVAVIKWLVKEFQFDIKVEVFSTVRDSNGLALSSRNYNLSEEGKKKASLIYKSLEYCRKNYKKENLNQLLEKAKSILGEDFKLDYFEVVDEETFQTVKEANQIKPRAFIAAYLEGVRLIDNMSLI